MTDKKIEIRYTEYADLSEMTPQDQVLVEAARQAQQSSYAPYSHFNVGAAVLLENGEIVLGSNQENAATPSGLCAERTAMFAAGARYPDKDMQSIALAGGVMGRLGSQPATPCGACRQVMAQYQAKSGKPMSVIMISAEKVWKFEKVDDILPLIFDSI